MMNDVGRVAQQHFVIPESLSRHAVFVYMCLYLCTFADIDPCLTLEILVHCRQKQLEYGKIFVAATDEHIFNSAKFYYSGREYRRPIVSISNQPLLAGSRALAVRRYTLAATSTRSSITRSVMHIRCIPPAMLVLEAVSRTITGYVPCEYKYKHRYSMSTYPSLTCMTIICAHSS